MSNTAITEVLEERARQDKKWGVQRHAPTRWLTILGEEFGETCKAALEGMPEGSKDYRAELIQVAAVAIAAIESYDAIHESETPE